mmetsp:Transcript_533/g.1158  ORF Transcript_533/g.1158 Transcript_533/m.1158 type:complete len:261 (+) Transcript_533:1504-2286(+)
MNSSPIDNDPIPLYPYGPTSLMYVPLVLSRSTKTKLPTLAGFIPLAFRLGRYTMAPCFRLNSLSMMQRSASWARPNTNGHLDAWISMSFPLMGPFEQWIVIFCFPSFTSSTLKTEFPAAKDAPLHKIHRSASRDNTWASLVGPSGPFFPVKTFAFPTLTAASPLSPRMCHPVVIPARSAYPAACSPSKSESRASTPADGPVMLSSMRLQMSSGLCEDGGPFPIVVCLPYKVQNAVPGSGFPSSSSSDVVNFKHTRNRDLV